MTIEKEISKYITSLPEAKQSDMEALRKLVLEVSPKCKLWFLDGRDEAGKVVTNPNIGFGSYTIKYADGSEKEFYQIGLSANTTGISVYIMGYADKGYLAATYGKTIGKATVTGYCIKFKKLAEIDLQVLETAIRDRFENH